MYNLNIHYKLWYFMCILFEKTQPSKFGFCKTGFVNTINLIGKRNTSKRPDYGNI